VLFSSFCTQLPQKPWNPTENLPVF